MAIAAMEAVLVYNVAFHLYTFLTTVDMEPQEILFLGAACIIQGLWKICVCAFGLSFLGNEKERTLANWKRMSGMLNLGGLMQVLICGGLYWYLENHAGAFRHTTGRTLEPAVTDHIDFQQSFIIVQFVLFAVFYFGFMRLRSNENSQPRILDEMETAILDASTEIEEEFKEGELSYPPRPMNSLN